MPTLAEVLKAANITDDVIAGLPKEATAALEHYVAQADGKLTTAQQAEANAREVLKNAGLEKAEIEEYVQKYGAALTKTASLEAQNKALVTYLESIKAQGFDVTIPTVGTTAAVVPGSPAVGANAFNPEEFAGRMGNVLAQVVDANNEHIRLTGQPLPDSISAIAAEAKKNRAVDITQFVEQKYKFGEIRASKAKAERDKEISEAEKRGAENVRREMSERAGGNPMLRPGTASAASTIKIKADEFHKSDGNVPKRERVGRMLERIHQDVNAAQQGA